MPETTEPFQAQLQAGIELPTERKFYFNGFAIAMSPTDVVIVLQLNNQPVATVNASPTMARTLAGVIEALLRDYESKTGQHVMALDEITAALSKGS